MRNKYRPRVKVTAEIIAAVTAYHRQGKTRRWIVERVGLGATAVRKILVGEHPGPQASQQKHLYIPRPPEPWMLALPPRVPEPSGLGRSYSLAPSREQQSA